MPAKNIECQLAQGQIGRYLAGTDMSPESVSQLEHHIAECEECTEFVDAKRKSLQELSQTRRAAISIPTPEPEPEPPSKPEAPRRSVLGQALVEAIRQKADPLAKETVLESAREPAAPRRTYWKALGYSIALGAVLLAMSHLAANPTALFGERVGPAPEASKPDAPAKKELAPNPPSDGDPFTAEPPLDPNPEAADAAAAGLETRPPSTARDGSSALPAPLTRDSAPSNPVTPRISPIGTPPGPSTSVRSQRPRRPARTSAPPARRSSPPPRSGNSIRVYGPDGQPIK